MVEKDSIDDSDENNNMVPKELIQHTVAVPNEQIGCERRLLVPFGVPEKPTKKSQICPFFIQPMPVPITYPSPNAPDDQFIHRIA
ncbi:hypothetical protein CEXT_232431 [Caerostris extrusa]|uniref:Uncharacterized protein n=1 Tax=Caerostris extrusa TaxID=172846 RepID=A0AAV4X8F9_CAEEX|nr:hypothetical protein CEXT_232431 [Caerostris extrusa]